MDAEENGVVWLDRCAEFILFFPCHQLTAVDIRARPCLLAEAIADVSTTNSITTD